MGTKEAFGRAYLESIWKPLIEEQIEQCSAFGKRPHQRRAGLGFRVGDVPAEEPVGAQRLPLLGHPANGDAQAKWQLIAGPLKAGLGLADWFQDDPRGVQKGLHIPLNRVIFAVEAKQPFGFGDKDASFLLGRGVHKKSSFESVEIEKNIPWTVSLVRPSASQPVEIGRPGLRIDVTVTRPIGHALARKIGAYLRNGQPPDR